MPVTTFLAKNGNDLFCSLTQIMAREIPNYDREKGKYDKSVISSVSSKPYSYSQLLQDVLIINRPDL